MINESAIQEIAKMAALGLELPDNVAGRAVIVSKDHDIRDLEDFSGVRFEYRGFYKTNCLDDFCAYLSAFRRASTDKGLKIFIDREKLAAVCFLNIGVPLTPGKGDHIAALKLVVNDAYRDASILAHKPVSQREMIEFMEDYEPELTCFLDDADGESVSTAAGIDRVRRLEIRKHTTTGRIEDQFKASESAFSEIELKSSSAELPKILRLTTSPHFGLDVRAIDFRLHVAEKEGKPMIRARFLRGNETLNQIRDEMQTKIEKLTAAYAETFIGTYDP